MSKLAVALLLLLPLCGLAARDPDLRHGQGDGSSSVVDGAVVGSLLKRAQELKQQHAKAGEVQEVDDRHELPDPEEDAENIRLLRMSRLKDDEGQDDQDFCYELAYRKRTLKLVKELPFVGLFRDLPENNVRFEASGICIAKGFAWVVFDSFRDIARLDLHFSYFGSDSIMVPDLDEAPAPEPVESQFEGLAYMESSDTFLVVRETFQQTETSRILSRTEEIRMNKDMSGFHTLRECIINFEFEDTNKGFEGIYYFEKKGKSYFLGLCESNYCKTVQGDDPPGLDPGNGRIVIAELHEFKGGCEWNVVKVVNVPPSAHFLDYSVISFHKYMGKTVAIASQEDAAVWVGKFDWDALEFYGKSKVFHFPRNEHCQKIYCNVEGLQFIDAQRVVLTSDKSKPIQPHACMHKDQSLAVMALPKYLN